MEQVWVALLRGINLAKRNRVPMAGLREVFEAAGCGSVKTYIASGNVVFTKDAADPKALARKLERAVADAFDVKTPIVLRTATQIRKVVDSHPNWGATTYTVEFESIPFGAPGNNPVTLSGLTTGDVDAD